MQVADPIGHGFAPDRLRRIDALLRSRYLDTGALPHAQLLVARSGEPNCGNGRRCEFTHHRVLADESIEHSCHRSSLSGASDRGV